MLSFRSGLQHWAAAHQLEMKTLTWWTHFHLHTDTELLWVQTSSTKQPQTGNNTSFQSSAPTLQNHLCFQDGPLLIHLISVYHLPSDLLSVEMISEVVLHRETFNSPVVPCWLMWSREDRFSSNYQWFKAGLTWTCSKTWCVIFRKLWYSVSWFHSLCLWKVNFS